MKQAEVDTQYRYWRRHIMLTTYGGYAFLYCLRKSQTFVMPAVATDLGWDIADVGLMGTLFYVVYGSSKFFSGMFSDRSNSRYFMGLGIMLSGIACLLSGLSDSLFLFIGLMVISAWFHGWGWPPCAKLLTSWYSQSERGGWWSWWNTSHNVGAGLSAVLMSYIAVQYGWRYGLIVSGLICVIAGLLVCWRLRDRPVTMGLPSIGDWRQDALEQAQEKIEPALGYRDALHTYVFKNHYIWLLTLSYALVYVVRIAISDWGSFYFTRQYGYSLSTANTILFMFEVGGFAGSLVASWGSDKLFGGHRGPMNLLCAIGIFLSIAALWLLPVASVVLQSMALFAIGFCVFGPQMLIGLAAAECSHKTTPGAATGLLGLFAYSGAALAGYPLALVIEHYQWAGFFIVLSVVSAVIGLLLLPFFRLC